jgi:hypothetical protein
MFSRDPIASRLTMLPVALRPILLAAGALVIIVFAGEPRRFIYFDF